MKPLKLRSQKKRAGRPRSTPRPSVTVTPAVQARSQATEARIFEAAETLFVKMGAAEATVADIVKEAGISVGAFYGRFADKEALIDAFCRRYLDDGRRRADALFAKDIWPRTGVLELTRAYAAYRVRHYQRNRRLLLAVVLHLRSEAGPDLRATAARFAAHFHYLVVRKFSEQPDAGAWLIDDRSIASALTLCEAVLKDLYLFDGGGLVSPGFSETELIEHLNHILTNCLNKPPTERGLFLA